ncbi:MAG: diguanylate cyclase [Magnetococcales bacterium]|nr:diguanylate cyclase [Magnetococcales bacterium]NGZ04779.1 diguanylate cyclase [Magnetococcales bacterium]
MASKVAALIAENEILRSEIRVARQAAELTAEMVVKQFEQTEEAQWRFRQANAQRQAVLEAATRLAIIVTDLDGVVQLFNSGAEILLGYKEEQVKGRCRLPDLIAIPELIERSALAGVPFIQKAPGLGIFSHYVAEKQVESVEWTLVRRDGTHLAVTLSISPMKDADGLVVGFLAAAMDVTELKKAKDEARLAIEMMDEAIAHSPIFVWEANAIGQILSCHGVEGVLGYRSDELIGQPYEVLFDPDPADNQEEESAAELWRQRFAGQVAFRDWKARLRHANGQTVWCAMNGKPVYDGRSQFQGYRGVNVDIHALTEAHQRVESLAMHDALTGLANRNRFLERFRLEMDRKSRHQEPMALLLLDIDHFKAVNDTHGHLNGDLCLQGVARIATASIRKIDLAARFGGEEFMILLPETGLETARQIAEKLRSRVELEKMVLLDQTTLLQITISIGVSEMRSDEELSLESLIHQADAALYVAKRSGRNRVRCWPV